MDYSRQERADRLAASYVAGTLRGSARRRFETLLPAHPVMRRAVRAWQDRLMPLTVSVAPVTPPSSVWQRIEARLGGVATPAASPQRWWQQLAVWRSISAAASVAVLSLAVLLASPGPAQPPLVVVLSAATPPAGGQAGGVVPASFVASISADGRAMVTRPLTQVSLQADRSLELWAVPPEGIPRSLGLISAADATVVRQGALPKGTVALAVSLEPLGGSPTAATSGPSGPVLYVGKLTI